MCSAFISRIENKTRASDKGKTQKKQASPALTIALINILFIMLPPPSLNSLLYLITRLFHFNYYLV